jgi:hypothetical protein
MGGPCSTDGDCHGISKVRCVDKPGFCSAECSSDADCTAPGFHCGSVEVELTYGYQHKTETNKVSMCVPQRKSLVPDLGDIKVPSFEPTNSGGH